MVEKQDQVLKSFLLNFFQIGFTYHFPCNYWWQNATDTDIHSTCTFLHMFTYMYYAGIFWKQHEAATKDHQGMWWHPLKIRFRHCIQYQSNGAYKTLHQSGTCISKLPSQHTLWDNMHHIEASASFSPEDDSMLIKAAQVGTCPKRNKWILLILDKMHFHLVSASGV